MNNNRQSNLTCPFCGTSFYRSQMSFVSDRLYLKRLKNRLEICPLGKNVTTSPKLKRKHPELIRLEMAACPNCHRITVCAVGLGAQYSKKRFNLYPQFTANPLPSYVPAQIRKDYRESVEIVKISPNSTAMLSRRILEEVIGDFYRVQEGDLYHDLETLRNNEKNQHIWQAIDAIRRFGNLSVHTVHDVNRIKANRNVSVKEANQLVKLILVLIHDTYVQRHYRQKIERKVIKSAKQMDYNPHYYDHDRLTYSSKHRNYNHVNHRWSSSKSTHRRHGARTYHRKHKRTYQKHGRAFRTRSNRSSKQRRSKVTNGNYQRKASFRTNRRRRRSNRSKNVKSKGFKIIRTPKGKK